MKHVFSLREYNKSDCCSNRIAHSGCHGSAADSHSKYPLAAANKALAWFELKNRAETPPPAAAPQSLFVKTEYRLRQIGFDSILYIEGLKDYVKIHVEEETHPVLTLTSLKSLEEQLPADRFVRVHRSFIVQPSKIRSIERNRIVFGKEYIPVSENYRQAFFDFLAEHSLLF